MEFAGSAHGSTLGGSAGPHDACNRRRPADRTVARREHREYEDRERPLETLAAQDARAEEDHDRPHLNGSQPVQEAMMSPPRGSSG